MDLVSQSTADSGSKEGAAAHTMMHVVGMHAEGIALMCGMMSTMITSQLGHLFSLKAGEQVPKP